MSARTTFSRTAAANQIATPAAPWTSQPRAGVLSRETARHPGRPLLVSRIDCAKVFLLAVAVVPAIALARRGGALPAWTVCPKRRAGGRTDRSGFGYLLLSLALAWAVYVSLPVLLIWMADADAMLVRERTPVSAGR